MVKVMQNLYSKPFLALLMLGLFIITLSIPDLSFAYYRYGSGYYGSHGHYGYSGSYRYGRHGSYSYYPNKYYQRNHYRYFPSRSYQQYPRSYSITIPAKIRVYGSNGVQYSNTEYSGINSSAWQTLGQGQYSAALNVFANEAQSHPDSGVPKAGYALATAANGDLERGVWAMRRAFRIDPDSLHYLQLDEKSHLLVDDLISQYSSYKNDGIADKGFIISALYYLKHDYSAAKKAIINAQQYGDKSSSITNLQRLINQQLVTGQEN